MARAFFIDIGRAAFLTASPAFRAILIKCLALSLLLLALAWAGLEWLAASVSSTASIWIRAPLEIAAGAAFVVCAAYLLGPICAILVGFFADAMSDIVERDAGPALVGRPLPVDVALAAGIRFLGLAIAVNAVALLLLLAPIVNAVAFLGANAILLGGASFEFAALRHIPAPQARELRRRHSGYIFLCGLVIALVLAIPILNLATPLFAVALMTRTFLRCSGALSDEAW